MPPRRITPAEFFVLAVIWSAVAYGMTAGGRPARTLAYNERKEPAFERRQSVRCYDATGHAVSFAQRPPE